MADQLQKITVEINWEIEKVCQSLSKELQARYKLWNSSYVCSSCLKRLSEIYQKENSFLFGLKFWIVNVNILQLVVGGQYLVEV